MNHTVSEKICFGIDVGGTAIKIGMFNTKGDMLERWQVPTNKNDQGTYILEDISEFISNLINERKIDKENVIGIGLGIPGPVRGDGVVIECVNLGWGVLNAANILSNLTGLNVKVNNDANVAALGEQWQGGGKGYNSTVLITLGTGVGGGVIINNRIVPGNNGAAGEIGHLTVNFDEEESCNCGRKGCLEQYASATGIVRLAKRHKKNYPNSSLNSMDKMNAKIVLDQAKLGDEAALEAVKEACRYLGIALTYVAATIDPDVFVIGGGVSNAGSILIDLAKATYEENVMKALKDKEFRLATLGNDAGMYGAARTILG